MKIEIGGGFVVPLEDFGWLKPYLPVKADSGLWVDTIEEAERLDRAVKSGKILTPNAQARWNKICLLRAECKDKVSNFPEVIDL